MSPKIFRKISHFFLRFGGTCPPKNNLLLKYGKFKMIGIIIYRLYCYNFLFSFVVSVSLQQHLRIRIWKGRVKGLGFGFMVLRVLVGIDWDYFGFWKFFKVISVGLGWPQFFLFWGSVPGGSIFHRYPEHRNVLWKWVLVKTDCGQFM